MTINRKYFVMTKDNCQINNGICSIDLPLDFVNSNNPNKQIILLSFMYYGLWVPRTEQYINLDYTTLHSKTLCDGNYHQNDYFITVLTYNYSTIQKVYPIRSKPQKLEVFFKNADGDLVDKFDYSKGESGYDDRGYEEKFILEFELIY